MSESNLDALQRALKLQKIQQAAQKVLKGRELFDFHGIKERHDQERDATEMLYRNEYKLRVDVAYRMLLKKAGSKVATLKPRFFGQDNLNPRALMRNAQRLVRFEHDRAMARLDARELKESNSFMEKSSQRTRYAETFKSAARPRPAQTHNPTHTPSE